MSKIVATFWFSKLCSSYTLSVKNSSVLIFVGQNFRQFGKISSLSTDEFLTDKVLTILKIFCEELWPSG